MQSRHNLSESRWLGRAVANDGCSQWFAALLLVGGCSQVPGSAGEKNSDGIATQGSNGQENSSASQDSVDGSSQQDTTPTDLSTTAATEVSISDDDSLTALPKFDLDDDQTWTIPDEEYPLYLLHIYKNKKLWYVSIVDGQPSEVCDLKPADSAMPSGTPGLSFNREDRLFISDGSALWEVLLPSCEVELKGKFGDGISSVNGILAGEDNALYGISGTLNQLIRIDVETGQATPLGKLGQKWGTHGASWSDARQGILGINGSTNSLYQIDKSTGAATEVAAIQGVKFKSVGMEIHPQDDQLYACTSDSTLYRIAFDGTASTVGNASSCGALWSADFATARTMTKLLAGLP